MTDYSELVKALRYCAESGDFNCNKDCPMYPNYPKCLTKMDMDAAAAIEELQAQLPKLGEWIWDDKRCIYVCSVCGSPKVRENMDRQIIKEQAYCYSCGAKMEVQDESVF